MTSDVDELLQLGRALLGVANDGEPCARPDAGNGSPQMRRGEVAVLARELLHVLIGYRLREQRLYIPLLGCTLHQRLDGLPRIGLLIMADDLQPHAETDLVLAFRPRKDVRPNASRRSPTPGASRRLVDFDKSHLDNI
jgi:hypothetical protein